ncbi:SUN domain-containing ossification factor isoform X2 [Syngnathoides biaculeatus]|uniref:SUN domain-containing ossification factor isoform X2 n=1 Tax=Syngnathoides biaculeatus TaxID=300417 RepID=UPI002ADDB63E|nr:SUN domain-containing ossification factor isoform X2 [Syngnathoides biaculeatus]
MKRLRVLVLVSLIVALLCWYPNHHAYCSEHSLSDPDQPAWDKDNNPDDHKQEQDSVQVQTVNPPVVEEEEEVSKSDTESDPLLAAPEPELSSESVIETDLRTEAQDQDGDQSVTVSSTLAEPVPEQHHMSSETPVPTELLGDEAATHLLPEPDSAAPAQDVNDTPTSQSDTLTPIEEANKEDQQPDQSQDSGAEAVVLSTSAHVEQQQEEEHEKQQQEEGRAEVQHDNASLHQQQVGEAGTSKDSDPSVPSKDDIPTFDEWKKQVMEVEKEKSQNLHTAANGIAQPVKKVQKNFKNNYASVECGAKILSANNEAKSTSAILMENMDLYMLNPCSNKIWFVIELCEPIQVKQLDIANFELFSSTPKDFVVSLSDRYPTNKWVKLGTFHARDERIVQTFPLDEQLYAKYVKMFIKYIKVELLSHFGSEHFCPLSLLRVFGTSMVEEYEEIADSQYPSERLDYLDEDCDYPPGYQPPEDKSSKNLLGSATNAILNMVNNIAANVLGGKPELEDQAGAEGNGTEVLTNKEGNREVAPVTPVEIPQGSTVEKPAEPEEHTSPEDADVSSTPASSLEPQTDRQIVTLVEEEEDEEPQQSTVTLLEEEEEEKSEEAGVDRESLVYCPYLSPLSLSCLATLPELLYQWCSAVLAEERLCKLQIQTRPVGNTPTITPPNIPPPRIPVLSPSPEALPLTEKAPELEVPLTGRNDCQLLGEAPVVPHADPQAHTTLPEIQLEPSRTSTLHPHSFSDIQASMTPTQQDMLLPPIKDPDLNPIPTPPLKAAPVPETQQLSATPPALSEIPLQQLPTRATDTLDAALPTSKEQDLPTASRPEDLIPHPTEQLMALPLIDSDTFSDLQKKPQQKPNTPPEDHADPHGGVPHKAIDIAEDDMLNGNTHRAATDFYAELQNGGDYNSGTAAGNGAVVHSSSQKESVFMRLNNRIKALEMNMSLSGRYLEELSQRYRKQMEEMQRAFNKTVIKLQNTSRIAEEQDQKQQDSIQVLQSQLENVTKLMLNLTATVIQLQKEISDRQSYLVVSLVLCVSLGLLVFLQWCRNSCAAPRADAASAPATLPKSNHYPSPKRCFSSYDDMSLKRRVACPLVRSKSFHLSSTEGPDDLYIVEPLRFSPEKKKKRCKTKSLDKVETVTPSYPFAHLTNGDIKCNGFHPCLPPPLPVVPLSLHLPLPPLPLPPPLSSPTEDAPQLPPNSSKESPSEASSSSSFTHSEESFAGRLPPPSPVYSCAELPLAAPLQPSRPPAIPPTKSRQERRSTKRRKSRQTELAGGRVASLPSLRQLMKQSKELGVGTIRVTAVSGQV